MAPNFLHMPERAMQQKGKWKCIAVTDVHVDLVTYLVTTNLL